MSDYNPPLSDYPTPCFPNFAGKLMPESMLDGMIQCSGIRLGWMKSHQCPCTLGSAVPGSPDPNCNTCHGRGIYWDQWTAPFMGLITYMHTSSAPDEPGGFTHEVTGPAMAAEPTLTIPFKGPSTEAEVWQNATEFDAYVELDALARLTSVLEVGQTDILPYQQNLDVQSVTVYDPIARKTNLISEGSYTVNGAAVSLAASYPIGTAYAVEYFASPVYIAFRRAGGLPHTRPFGGGLAQIPRRFRLVTLDLWSRARQNGFLGQSTSPQGLP